MQKIDIINLALARLGQASIASLSEGSEEAAKASAVWEGALLTTLQACRWGFNVKREPLALLEEKTIKLAAGCFEFPIAGVCPFKEELDASGDRAWAKRELARWQERVPDLKTLMLKSMSKVEVEWLLDSRYL